MVWAEVLLVAAPLRRCGAGGGLAGALGIASSVRMGLALGCFGGVAAAADGPLLATLVAVADALSAPGVLRALATGVGAADCGAGSGVRVWGAAGAVCCASVVAVDCVVTVCSVC